MAIAGFGRTQIPYDMFDLEQDAATAKRFVKCEGIYHRAQRMAWDGKEILPMLMEQHGGVNIGAREKQALEQVFAIILWGELAAWKISAQLADQLVELEPKMAATSQAFDEARHFYTMYDYLREIDYVPKTMDRAPQALLDLVLDTDVLAHKLVGMQLMVETIALGIFQGVRESNVEPVLCDLLKYFERDEARHVGLGMQYLPTLMKKMSPFEVAQLSLFQARLMSWALREAKLLEPDLAILGIEVRDLIDRVRRKQLAAMVEAYAAIGISIDRQDNVLNRTINAAVEAFFPEEGQDPSATARAQAAYDVLRNGIDADYDGNELSVHEQHAIKLARGGWSNGETGESADDAAAE